MLEAKFQFVRNFMSDREITLLVAQSNAFSIQLNRKRYECCNFWNWFLKCAATLINRIDRILLFCKTSLSMLRSLPRERERQIKLNCDRKKKKKFHFQFGKEKVFSSKKYALKPMCVAMAFFFVKFLIKNRSIFCYIRTKKKKKITKVYLLYASTL